MAFKMFPERTRTYSTSCCCCFHVRTGTIVLGASYIAIHAAITVLLLVFTFHPESFKNYQTSITPIPYNEGRMDCETMFPIGVSLFVMVIGAMMIYGAFTHRSGWLVPFICYQMFDFAINCFMMLGLLKTLPTLKAHTHLYKNELWDVNTNWLIAFLLLIFGLILVLKAYFLCCVWNCYKYIVNRYTANAQVFSDRNIEQFLPPSYDTAIAIPNKVPPPPYSA